MTMRSTPAGRWLPPFLRRVTVCFTILMFIIWMNGVFAIYQLNRVDAESKDIQEQAVGSTAVLGQLAADLSAFRAVEATHILSRGADERIQWEGQMKQLQTRITYNIRQYESLDSTAEEKRLFLRFLAGWYAYDRHSKARIEELAANDIAEATAAFAATEPVYGQASQTLAQLIRINVERGREIYEESDGIYRSSVWFIVIAAGLGSLLVIGMLVAMAWHEER